MDDLTVLFWLSVAMFIGSYVAGILPLIVSFSESKLRLVTIVGAGLLVGTALAVIIPEGVQSIYTAQSKSAETHHTKSLVAQTPVTTIRNAILTRIEKDSPPGENHRIPNLTENSGQSGDNIRHHHHNRVNLADSVKSNRIKREAKAKSEIDRIENIDLRHDHETDKHEHAHIGEEIHIDVHNAVGLALVAGFVLMLLVDQLAQGRMTQVDTQSGIIMQQPRYKITATIGLVVHAAADGVALGAASGSSHADVQFVVFLAIMLHKAPASFGLVTFLLHEGLDRARVKRHLLIFALSAPVAALVTYIFIAKGGPTSLTSLHSTGVLLLFSAGTFLYVATVHVLPEITSSNSGHSHGGGGYSGLKINELLALVVGAILPTVLTVGHSH
uniref:Uncharacterized protein n=1 Tax=Romanomermis culicivorax TaxID=13658 RepID=A0A915JGA8_ROMCU